MKTKLTLRLDEAVIERAKAYAAKRGTSVSGLVEDYFRLVASEPAGGDGAASDPASDWRADLGPRVRALLDRPNPTVQVDDDDYKRYLVEKYS